MATTEQGTPIAGGYGLHYESLRAEKLMRTVLAGNDWMYDESNFDKGALWAMRQSLIREGIVVPPLEASKAPRISRQLSEPNIRFDPTK